MPDFRPILPGPVPDSATKTGSTAPSQKDASEAAYLEQLIRHGIELCNAQDWEAFRTAPFISETFTAHLQMHYGAPVDLETFLANFKHQCEMSPGRRVDIVACDVVLKDSRRSATALVDLETKGNPPGVVVPSTAMFSLRKEPGGWVCTKIVSMRGAVAAEGNESHGDVDFCGVERFG